MGSVIGGIIGNIAGGDERRGVRDSISEAVGAFRDIKIPTIEEQRIALEHLRQQGVLTPELEEAILQDPSLLNQISADPVLRDAQLSALESLKTLGRTGLDATDRAAYNEIRLRAARDSKAVQDAILQNMAQRGMAGGGQELAAKLSAAQNSAEEQARQGDALAAAAAQRRLQAIAQAGQLGGNIREQDFGEEARKATAQDAINQFNIRNRADVQRQNIAAKNEAQLRNLAEKQRIADTNVGLTNQQEIHNKGLYQRQFDNQMNRAAGLSGQLANRATMHQNEANRIGEMWAGIGEGVSNAGSSYASKKHGGGSEGMSTGLAILGAISDETKKENKKELKDKDIKQLLDKLKAYKYNYKNDDKKEEQTGVMAQDMEKSELGKEFIKETPEGKIIDYGKAMNATYATLSNLHERLKKLEGK